jgi:hypothetical protein
MRRKNSNDFGASASVLRYLNDGRHLNSGSCHNENGTESKSIRCGALCIHRAFRYMQGGRAVLNRTFGGEYQYQMTPSTHAIGTENILTIKPYPAITKLRSSMSFTLSLFGASDKTACIHGSKGIPLGVRKGSTVCRHLLASAPQPISSVTYLAFRPPKRIKCEIASTPVS